jgi:hypothetical protein
MISEHHFANSYASVWHQLTPRSDGYWKIENMLVTREAAPLPARAATGMRGVVNETSFRAFCALRTEGGIADRARVLAAVDKHTPDAIEYVARLAPSSNPDLTAFDDACRREAVLLALRLLHHFPGRLATILRPRFQGCGLISACEGDVLEGECLYEVKAGDRAFRITDLRQLLVYSALAYSSGSLNFKRVGLFNPRTGTAWVRTLDQVCQSIAGTRATDTLSALVSQFSEVSASR